MPGRYPGRVLRVHNPDAVRSDHTLNENLVRKMVHRGLVALVDGDPKDPQSAWRKFFEKGDVVGIKVNPVGRKPKPGEAAGSTAPSAPSPAPRSSRRRRGPEDGRRRGEGHHRLRALRRRVSARRLREADERSRDGRCPLVASAAGYTDTQLDIEGFDRAATSISPELARHVVGYDPDVFAHMGFCAPEHDPKDDRRFRSHLSVIVSRMVNKIITIPCLKDHRSAGVTLALKNMSHGMNNNVARSHISRHRHGLLDGALQRAEPVQHVHPARPSRQQPMRAEGDAAHPRRPDRRLRGRAGLLEPHLGHLALQRSVLRDRPGGDGSRRLGHHRRQARRDGLGPGRAHGPVEPDADGSSIARSWRPWQAGNPLEAAALAVSAKNMREGRSSEAFDLRTPQHVSLAGDLGPGRVRPEAHRLSHDPRLVLQRLM